jgi:pyruvate,water dikinase
MLVRKGSRLEVGSKAYDLIRCKLLNVNVPDFFVIPTKYFQMYKNNGKRIDSELINDLKLILRKFGGLVAVRSSSVAEDLHSTSNAGRFKTELNVNSIKKLTSALKNVWSSSNGYDMAVIIQKQLIPDVSGVLFTRNPINGKNETVIEYVDGLCSPLVGGTKDPQKIIIESSKKLRKNHLFLKLIKISKQLELSFGYPLDIEWARCGNIYYILQARPITRLPPPSMHDAKTYSRVQAEQFFSGPVCPLFHSIFKRLYLKYYIKETVETLKMDFKVDDELLIRHKSYLYVDTRFYEYALTHLPVKNNRDRLLEIFPEDIREVLRITKTRPKPLVAIKILFFILFHPQYWVTNLDKNFKNQVVPTIIEDLGSLKNFHSMTNYELYKSYMDMEKLAIFHIRTSKWGLGLYSIPLTELMGKFLEKNRINKKHLSILISGLKTNRTLDASLELERLSKFILNNCEKTTLDIFKLESNNFLCYRSELEKTKDGQKIIDYFDYLLFKFGHRRVSRDIYQPSWSDDPIIPFSILKKLVSEHTPRTDNMKNFLVTRREKTERKIYQNLPFSKKQLFKLLSNYMIRYVAFREFQRFYLDMILQKLKQLILEISKRMVKDQILNEINDIFFLELSDIIAYLNGKKKLGLKKKAEFNKLSFDIYENTPGRYLRSGVDFDLISIMSKKNKRNNLFNSQKATHRVIKGQPLSPGYFSGKVKILEQMNNNIELEQNDIVVTRCIDPGQTHLFLLAGALVFEIGGILSHGAILAREFNLPTVAQVKNATKIFKDGQIISVNGTKGEIILESSSGDVL